jgi:hypothetical protein
MSSTARNENDENINNENTPPQALERRMASQLLTQTPTLVEPVYTGSAAEDRMIQRVNAAIRSLLTRPSHQSPYRYNFRWRINEEPNLNCTVFLSIREPSRRNPR